MIKASRDLKPTIKHTWLLYNYYNGDWDLQHCCFSKSIWLDNKTDTPPSDKVTEWVIINLYLYIMDGPVNHNSFKIHCEVSWQNPVWVLTHKHTLLQDKHCVCLSLEKTVDTDVTRSNQLNQLFPSNCQTKIFLKFHKKPKWVSYVYTSRTDEKKQTSWKSEKNTLTRNWEHGRIG